MGATIIEKIIRNNTGIADAKANDIVTVNVDYVMIHDIFIPFVADKFEEMGFAKICDPEKVVLIYDHLVPASQVDDTRHFRVGNAFVEKYGLTNVHRSDGICHQLMTEAGYVKPGNIVFGTDSHTTTYGCVGAFSSGIGYTEMASILGTGTMWIKVPETIKVTINGKLPSNVTSKDIILRLIGDLGADGATYQALEFGGDTVEEMTMVHYNGELLMGSTTDDAEKLANDWGSNTIPAHGVQRFGSGMPVQALTHSEIVIKGVDAKGNHLQFQGILSSQLHNLIQGFHSP